MSQKIRLRFGTYNTKSCQQTLHVSLPRSAPFFQNNTSHAQNYTHNYKTQYLDSVLTRTLGNDYRIIYKKQTHLQAAVDVFLADHKQYSSVWSTLISLRHVYSQPKVLS